MRSSNATLLGISAIIMWSTITALMRTISEAMGAHASVALIFSLSSMMLCLTQGIPTITKASKRYLMLGGTLFICYEFLLATSIGLSDSRQQVIEVSLINYLWPCLIVLFSLWLNKQSVNFLIWPGALLSFLGVAWSLTSNLPNTSLSFLDHMKASPLPYVIATIAAILWALYCNISKRLNHQINGVPLFFIIIAIIMWIKFFFSGDTLHIPPLSALIELIILSSFLAISYSCWEVGIQKGNLLLLAILSYFTPLLSVLFSKFWLNTPLNSSFWLGVIMVVIGSLCCWQATKTASEA